MSACGAGCGGATPTPNPGCSATAPTNLHVTRDSNTNVTALNWTPGAGGTKQKLFLDIDKADVAADCGGTSCLIKKTNLNKNLNTYAVSLASGTVYYWKVVTYKNASCHPDSGTETSVSSCILSPDPLLILDTGENATLTAVVSSSSVVNRITFTPASGIITATSPDYNGADGYNSTVTGISAGTTTITSAVYLSGDTTFDCSDSTSVLVNNPGGSAWWQVVDSDVLTNGNLESAVPAGKYFGLAGAGGLPGRGRLWGGDGFDDR